MRAIKFAVAIAVALECLIFSCLCDAASWKVVGKDHLSATITFTGTIVPARGLSVHIITQPDGTRLAQYTIYESGTPDAFTHTETIPIHTGETTAVAIRGMSFEIGPGVAGFAYAKRDAK